MAPRKKRHHQERRIRIRAVRCDPPDLKKLASALIALAQAQAEADAEADHQATDDDPDTQHDPEPPVGDAT